MLGLQRFASGISTQLFRRAAYSSTTRATSAVAAAPKAGNSTTEGKEEAEASTKPRKNLVAAAFDSLNSENPTNDPKSKSSKLDVNNNIDERIINAKTVNGLLSISEIGTISRKQALRIVSILADWSSMNRVKLSEFENDSRFLKLCRILGRTIPKGESNGHEKKKSISGFRTDDLNTVLGVAGDDEAAKLIASISLPQMVKVMSTLAQRKRRSTPLLRSLAFNISSSTDTLDLKQCADVLFAMATLNFPDSVLAAKICADVQAGLLKNNDRSAVVGSILTSLGILKYRDLDILEALTQWALKYYEICRPQDLSALFLTSSMLNFKSSYIEDIKSKLVKSVAREDFSKQTDWLNQIWALSMLGLVTETQLENVLSSEFIQQLENERPELSPNTKMKLLNINSYAQLMAPNYKGPLLPADSVAFELPIAHSKSKQLLHNGVVDALKSLLPANNHFQTLIDTKMGFLIDALCYFDSKRNPLPLNTENPNAIKVAIMVVDFHDVCHGAHRSASGITNLYFDLLEKSGYQIISVPYNEFSTSDKLLKRVQYLEGKFKSVIRSKNVN